jgi:hypothetical protein
VSCFTCNKLMYLWTVACCFALQSYGNSSASAGEHTNWSELKFSSREAIEANSNFVNLETCILEYHVRILAEPLVNFGMFLGVPFFSLSIAAEIHTVETT